MFLDGISPLQWKKYLLPMSVAFAVTYNLPKYFEMKIETADNVTTIVPTGEKYGKPKVQIDMTDRPLRITKPD